MGYPQKCRPLLVMNHIPAPYILGYQSGTLILGAPHIMFLHETHDKLNQVTRFDGSWLEGVAAVVSQTLKSI